MVENDGERSPKENGERRSNGVAAVDSKSDRSLERQPDIVDDHPGKSRSTLHSCHTSVILCNCSRSGILLKVDEQESKH